MTCPHSDSRASGRMESRWSFQKLAEEEKVRKMRFRAQKALGTYNRAFLGSFLALNKHFTRFPQYGETESESRIYLLRTSNSRKSMYFAL